MKKFRDRERERENLRNSFHPCLNNSYQVVNKYCEYVKFVNLKKEITNNPKFKIYQQSVSKKQESNNYPFHLQQRTIFLATQ